MHYQYIKISNFPSVCCIKSAYRLAWLTGKYILVVWDLVGDMSMVIVMGRNWYCNISA